MVFLYAVPVTPLTANKVQNAEITSLLATIAVTGGDIEICADNNVSAQGINKQTTNHLEIRSPQPLEFEISAMHPSVLRSQDICLHF